MRGIYIPGLRMPKDGFITITVTSDGRVVGNSKKESGKFEYLDNEDIASAIPVPDHGRLLKVLKTERECVSRDCDRNCGKCDLSLEQSEILTVYDTLVSMFSDPSDKEGKG